MQNRFSLPLILGVSLVGASLVACGGDDAGDAADEVGDGDGDSTTGDGDGDGDPTGDGDGGPSDCMVWEIAYDLSGSAFEIEGTFLMLGDQVNTVEEPYDAADTVGPGSYVLHFQDVDGAPGGQAFMHSYAMSMHFAVDSLGVNVATDLEDDAGPEECGITSGAVDGTTVAWMPSAIVGTHSMGQILCTGNLCGQAMLPNGEPVPVDETSDQPITEFVFNDDFSGFTMAKTIIQMVPDVSTTSWTYVGTEVSRELVAAPDCLCQ